MSILKILLFIIIVLQSLSDDKIDYDGSTINKMKNSIFKTKSEKIYYLKNYIDSSEIIGFTDLDYDKYTDIITYKRENETDNHIFKFYAHYYKHKKKKFSDEEYLFNITINKENTNLDKISVRNLHIGSFFDKKPYFLVSFNNGTDSLAHYIMNLEKDFKQVKLNISSNILIMNKDEDKYVRLLYFNRDEDKQRREICQIKRIDEENKKIICDPKPFSDYLIEGKENKDYTGKDLSLKGGLGYVDIIGNCVPDIILSHEEGEQRIIEIYVGNYKENSKFKLDCIITLDKASDYGAFAITRVNDVKKDAPALDLLIPNITGNKILYYRNHKNTTYTWSSYYCKEKNKETRGNDQIFNKDTSYYYEYTLSIDEEEEKNQNLKVSLDGSLPTVIRVGDFLGTSNPGIIVKQIIEENGKKYSQISLFERDDKKFKYYAGFKLDKIPGHESDDEFKMGLFFDINEAGSLSFILPTVKNNNYFFFNYRRNIFFIKSKLMNDEDYYYDSNLGATFRYIVTNKKGKRHMDISYQLTQTSDMNIPLPYSFMGLDDTNNYVEYFETISGNIIKKKVKTKNSEKNYKENSPIIPNTQMMISKYYDGSKIEWNVDLIVQPMEQIWLFLVIVIIVLLIVLGIIIYLHLKEVKEEQKETNKFKSWFA